jgi:hypothetical protein
VNSTLYRFSARRDKNDEIAACQRNSDRFAEEETRAKAKKNRGSGAENSRHTSDEKEHQAVQSTQENRGFGVPSTPPNLV